MNIIKVKDYDSMQAITVSLAKNGYLVTADSVTDEHYKDHWEIKYCEISEITKKSNYSDFDGDYLGSMEIHNKDNTKGVKSEIVPDEKIPRWIRDGKVDPDFKPVKFDEKGNIIKNDEKPVFDLDEKPLVEKESENVDPISIKSVQKHKKNINIPNIPIDDNGTLDNVNVINE